MAYTSKSQCNVQKLTRNEILDKVASVNGPLVEALREFCKALKNTNQLLPVFSVRYGYVNVIVGPSTTGGASKLLLGKCNDHDGCSHCTDLLTECADRIPLGIVLTNTAEVYLEYDHVDGGTIYPESVPLRVLNKGDAFGIFELLDDIACSPNVDMHRTQAQWRVSSGVRSISISSPLGNQAIAEKLLHAMRENSIPNPTGITKPSLLSSRMDRDGWLFMKAVVALTQNYNKVTNDHSSHWSSELLIIPASWLRGLLANSSLGKTASQFLLTLYQAGWKQSLHLRQYYSDLPHLAGALASYTGGDKKLKQNLQLGYIHRTLLHIIAIARGDLPGFVPVSSGNQAGPFMEAVMYLKYAGFSNLPGLNGNFPFLLQPCQIDARSNSPETEIYYS
ncbi:MAG: hypothetical protein ACYCOU_11640, partial [Sulfobacillus sp.]